VPGQAAAAIVGKVNRVATAIKIRPMRFIDCLRPVGHSTRRQTMYLHIAPTKICVWS
jgi:hypothetical protein